MKHTDERSHKQHDKKESAKRNFPHGNVKINQRILTVRKELGYVLACLWWYANNHGAEITLFRELPTA